MSGYKCAFSNTLVTNQFGCARGEPVARRGGPDVACTSEPAHQRCEQLFQRMKAEALPAFGVEDDLLTMPHSVLVKIQHGGLLGLQRLLGGDAAASRVPDVGALVESALARYPSVAAIPCAELVESMTAYKLKRRG